MESHLDQAGVSVVLSGVWDGTLMAPKVSAGFRKALALRAAELVSLVPLRSGVPQRIREQPAGVPVSQILDAFEALQVQVHAISKDVQTSLLPQLQKEIVKVASHWDTSWSSPRVSPCRRSGRCLCFRSRLKSRMLCSSLRGLRTDKQRRRRTSMNTEEEHCDAVQ